MPPILQLTDANQNRLVAAAPNLGGLHYGPGRKALNILHLTGNVVADETFVIGADTYQIKALTTDTTRTASLATGEVVSLLTLSGAPGVALVAGDLIRIDNEICKIHEVLFTPANSYRVLRGRCGTTVAVHTTASVFQAAAVSATNIPIGFNATLTPAVAVPAIVAEINNAAGGMYRATAKASTIYDPGSTFADSARTNKVVASPGPAADCVIVQSALEENCVLATTEAFTNALWTLGATMLYGVAQAAKRIVVIPARAVTAAEVTAGKIVIPVAFNPSMIIETFRVTASGVRKAWGGATSQAASGSGFAVTFANNASTDFAATDTFTCVIRE